MRLKDCVSLFLKIEVVDFYLDKEAIDTINDVQRQLKAVLKGKKNKTEGTEQDQKVIFLYIQSI